MPRERALACAVRLLDLGFFRIGGEAYAEENESYGAGDDAAASTSRSRTGEVVFDFPAKSGQRRVQSIRDPRSMAAIEAMRRRRSGPDDLLVFREDGAWHDVRSDDVNAYLQEKVGEEFSAKDFRTWHGTVLAAVELAGEERALAEAAAKRAIRAAIERVAERSATRRRSAAAPTSTPASSIASATARRSSFRGSPPGGNARAQAAAADRARGPRPARLIQSNGTGVSSWRMSAKIALRATGAAIIAIVALSAAGCGDLSREELQPRVESLGAWRRRAG